MRFQKELSRVASKNGWRQNYPLRRASGVSKRLVKGAEDRRETRLEEPTAVEKRETINTTARVWGPDGPDHDTATPAPSRPGSRLVKMRNHNDPLRQAESVVEVMGAERLEGKPDNLERLPGVYMITLVFRRFPPVFRIYFAVYFGFWIGLGDLGWDLEWDGGVCDHQ